MQMLHRQTNLAKHRENLIFLKVLIIVLHSLLYKFIQVSFLRIFHHDIKRPLFMRWPLISLVHLNEVRYIWMLAYLKNFRFLQCIFTFVIIQLWNIDTFDYSLSFILPFNEDGFSERAFSNCPNLLVALLLSCVGLLWRRYWRAIIYTWLVVRLT